VEVKNPQIKKPKNDYQKINRFRLIVFPKNPDLE
jgi:hypothetical protein